MRFSFLAVILLFSACGCATYKNFSPAINEPTRAKLTVSPPLLVSVFDGRGNREGSSRPDQDLISGIQGAYPNAVQIVDYFSPTPAGRARVRIRVQELGAQFGNRLVSGVTVQSQFTRASGLATDGWGTVVAQAAAQQNTFGSALAAEGWWIGTAWLEVQVEDKRRGRNVNFTLPLVAEHKESNMWGYASAQAATKRAWSTVSAKLFSTLDSALLNISPQNTTPAF